MKQSSVPLPILGEAPPRAGRADAAANHRRILATAEKLFARQGVADVHMADIARAAGVGQGTLYRHFASKGELCLALLDEQMAEFQDRALATLRAMSAQRERKLDQLSWFLDALVYFNARHAPLLCAAQREVVLPEGPTGSPFQWQRLTVAGLLQAAERDGEIESGLDLPAIADLLLAPTHPLVFNFLHTTAGYSLERISAAIRRMVRGLVRR
jgi:AcrR family transcriptional regulator